MLKLIWGENLHKTEERNKVFLSIFMKYKSTFICIGIFEFLIKELEYYINKIEIKSRI